MVLSAENPVVSSFDSLSNEGARGWGGGLTSDELLTFSKRRMVTCGFWEWGPLSWRRAVKDATSLETGQLGATVTINIP